MIRVRFGVLVVSDSCSQGLKADKSGPIIQQLIKSSKLFEGDITCFKLLPDELDQIKQELCYLTHFDKTTTRNFDIIVTIGGTGFSERDVTPEATRSVIEKEANGLTVALLARSLRATKNAALSRLCAGIRNRTLIVNFPGNAKAVQECWEVLEPLVCHTVALLGDDRETVAAEHKVMQQNQYSRGCSRSVDVSLHTTTGSGVASRARHSPYPMITVDEALKTVALHCPSDIVTRVLNVEDAVGFVLAEDVISSESIPPFAASIKDGYAVRAEDGMENRKVIGVMEAGSSEQGLFIEQGTCVRISTGASIPKNANSVVQVEDTEVLEQQGGEELKISVKVAPTVGQDIRPLGSDIAVGECILQKGTFIRSCEIGLMTSTGHTDVAVYSKPRVAVLSTGNELVTYSMSGPLPAGKIRDSNGPMLAALLREHSFPTETVSVARDELSQLSDELNMLFALADVLITSGGVSMGEKDLLKKVLVENFQFQIHFGRVHMKPGKPMTFASGIHGGAKKLVFALPGNPVSAWVTAHLFVLPTLRRMSGFGRPNFSILQVKLLNDIWHLDARPEYCRAKLILPTGHTDLCLKAEILETNQISSRLLSNRYANLLLKLPAKSTAKSSMFKDDIVDAIVIQNY